MDETIHVEPGQEVEIVADEPAAEPAPAEAPAVEEAVSAPTTEEAAPATEVA